MRAVVVGAIATAIAIGVATGGGGGGGGGGLPATHICSGRSFYVDFATGSDTNNGTSTATPWKTAPGMRGGGSHNSYAHVAHDCFYFKGGVTWTSGNYPWEPTAGGNAGDRDYYGPKYDWFTGGTWTRPILNAGGVITGSCGSVAGNADSVICEDSADYITLDDFEITNWSAGSCAGNDNCSVIFAYDNLHLLWDHLYIHNLTSSAFANFTNSKVIAQATFGNESQSILQNSIIQCEVGNNVLDATRAVNYVINSMINGCNGMVFPSGDGDVSGNSLIDCNYSGFPAGVSGAHADAIQVNPVSTPPAHYTIYIHNNLINGTGSDANGNECELGLIGNPGETDYVWDNISYNIKGNSWQLNQLGGVGDVGDAAYFWNNTMVGSGTSNGTQVYAGFCLRVVAGTWPILKVQNDHCITDGTAYILSATSLTQDHDVTRTKAQADSDLMTAAQTPYVFFPPSGAAPTVNVGIDLSANCAGTLTDLCSDTKYGVTVDANNRVVGATRTVVARPQGGTWDVGAYER